jgi:integrase/recombinase XerD
MVSDVDFERRLDEITEGLQPFIREHLLTKISRENAKTIVDYMLAFESESNPVDDYRQVTINMLKQLSAFKDRPSNKQIPFKQMTREDILAFLNRLKKKDEEDPLHHWIGTYNGNVIIIVRFFKWLYFPLLEPKKRPKPETVQTIIKLNRKEEEIYDDGDLWDDPDCNRMFFTYVTSARDKAFHALMLDTICRPKALMNAKIKDLQFRDEGYNQKNAIITVTEKSGKRKDKLIVKSLPYLRDWLTGGGNGHPNPENPNAYIFCSTGRKNRGKKLARQAFSHQYMHYRRVVFPKLAAPMEEGGDPTVPEEDKKIIREKMLTRPFKPYILRHTSINEKRHVIGDSDLRDAADWSKTSQMPKRYEHFGRSSSLPALERAQGIFPIDSNNNGNRKENDALKPNIICSHCREPNKPEAKFCSNPKCGMVLSFKAGSESIAAGEKIKKKIDDLEARLSSFESMFNKINEGKKQIEENFKRMIELNS